MLFNKSPLVVHEPPKLPLLVACPHGLLPVPGDRRVLPGAQQSLVRALAIATVALNLDDVYVGGDFERGIQRLNDDGSLDFGFATGDGFNGPVTIIVAAADGPNRMDDIVRCVNELETGTVNIWEEPGYRIEMSPFGGIKDSGLGYKEGVIEAIKSYTNVKTFSLPW